MKPFPFVLDERLAEAGDTLSFSGHADDDSYSLGSHEFSLPSGIDFDLVLTNAGDGILVTGMLRAHVAGVCDRCLDPAEMDISAEVAEYYLFEELGQLEQDEDDDLDYALVAPDNTIDLSDALLLALLMETPFVVLCSEDCKGLCPMCGENLNEVDCGHAQLIIERRAASNPFSVLASLDLGERADPSQ